MGHKHSVYDSDTHFSINPINRAIRNESSRKTTLIQGDHNSERFTFDLPRYIEGHDMSACDVVEVHYLNITHDKKNQKSGVYTVTDLQISPEDDQVVVCSWLISQNATQLAGSLNFLLKFRCTEGDTTTYAWHTDVHKSISVSDGINAGESLEADYVDIVEQWKSSAVQDITGAVNANVSAWAETESGRIRGLVLEETTKTNAALNVERKRIDLMQSGATADDAELIDIRVGADGVTHDSAGDAVRHVENKINALIKVDIEWFENGYINHNSGNHSVHDAYIYTDFVERHSGTTIAYRTYIGSQAGIAIYDEDKKYIGGISGNGWTEGTISTGRYIRFTSNRKYTPEVYVTDLLAFITSLKPSDSVDPCNYTGCEIGVFNKGICIGDSLTSGVFNYKDGDGGRGNYVSYEKYSYPYQLAKMTGIEVTSMAVGGLTSAEWLSKYASDDLSGHDFAIIQLGVNDGIEYGGWTQTSINAYVEIVTRLKAQNKNIKIFVATIVPAASYQSDAMTAVSAGIRAWVAGLDDEDVILLDMAEYGHTNDLMAYNCGHLSAYGYWRLACDYKAYISWYIGENPDKFRELQFVGTDYTFT